MRSLMKIYRCKTYLWISVTLTSPALLSIIVNVILVLRLHALYDRNIKILAVLSSLIVADIGGNIFIMYRIGVLTSRSAFVIPPILGLPILGCLAAPDSTMLTFISWVPCVFLNTLFFIMTMIKFYQSTMAKQRRGVRLSPLIVAFFTSGTMSFFIIASMAIVSAAITILVDGPLQILYMPWIIVTFSLAGSRLILNLREAGASNQPIAAMPTSSSLTVVERFSRLDA
ncbi:unnamed protein product [Cyclocybe aegerita]|uniref:Uncharacterized protein n=1 Tax=Cyclocybe aegerita TaxID=1973307 RepID=A0A8S0W9A6_CYCAE|nr:unnamed protein product [Cyclocybe aegerita]